jgi:hypothetical protein
VRVFEDLIEPFVELEGHSLAEVIYINHRLLPFLGWDRPDYTGEPRARIDAALKVWNDNKVVTGKTRINGLI